MLKKEAQTIFKNHIYVKTTLKLNIYTEDDAVR